MGNKQFNASIKLLDFLESQARVIIIQKGNGSIIYVFSSSENRFRSAIAISQSENVTCQLKLLQILKDQYVSLYLYLESTDIQKNLNLWMNFNN